MGDEGLEVTISCDAKTGRIVVDGVDPEIVKSIKKKFKKGAAVMQVFPDGFMFSEDGVFLSRIDNDRPIGYA